MNFKEQLELSRENGLNILDLVIANNIEDLLDRDYSDIDESMENKPIEYDEKTFEELCLKCKNAYLFSKTENPIYDIADTTIKLFVKKGLNDFDEYDVAYELD